MEELVIQLTGKIVETNFDEWKLQLISRIEGLKRELKNDQDFALATHQVGEIKSAEVALKQAKQSAIDQAADIQKLFSAIDEVSSSARDARLTLERQIKERKQEIKDEIVKGGLTKMRQFLEAQSEDAQMLDLREFTDRGLFIEATKRKRDTASMETAITDLVEQLKAEVSSRAAEVEEKATKLARLEPRHQVLFQDRRTLLNLAAPDLDAAIEKRIALFEEEQSKAQESAPEVKAPPATDNDSNQDKQLDLLSEDQGEKAPTRTPQRITLTLRATAAEATALETEIRTTYADRAIVQEVRLESAGDSSA